MVNYKENKDGSYDLYLKDLNDIIYDYVISVKEIKPKTTLLDKIKRFFKW